MTNRGIQLVVGADGHVGSALIHRLQERRTPVLGTTRRRGTEGPGRVFLDLAEIEQPWALPERFETAYLTAAISSLLPCERDPLTTSRVNVRGTLAVARGLQAQGTHVIFLSSNQVFDGETPNRHPDEPARPQSVYGRTKAEVEAAILAPSNLTTVVRFGKLLEPGNALLEGWVADLRAGRVVRPFRDLVLAPVSVRFAVDVLLGVAERRMLGIVQVSAQQDVSYEDVARYLARRLGASEALIQPGHSRDAGFPQACVPRHTTLDTTRLRGELGLTPPDVWETIDEVLGL